MSERYSRLRARPGDDVRIALIPTGRMELHGLVRCLGRLFPSHEFVVVAERLDARDGPHPFNGFTSSSIPTPLREPSEPSTTLTKLVEAMAGELERGRARADLCVVLDDLELANVDRPRRVIDAIRHEVGLHLQHLERRSSAHADRVRQALLERGSFHFAVPMIESWLLADPGSTGIVGVPGDRHPRLSEHRDPEDFLTSDPDYEVAGDEECAAMAAKPRRRRKRAAWVRPDRTRHPKAYLSWLCRDPAEPDCTRYRETGGGASALAQLDWPTVVRRPDHMRYARALLADLADVLGGWPSSVAHGGDVEPLTSIHEVPRDQVLRNM